MTDEDNEAPSGGTVTVPPPEGEEDPYGAPTRVAPMAHTVLAELTRAHAETSAKAKANALAKANANVTASANVTATPTLDESENELAALAAAATHVVAPPMPEADSVPVHVQSGRTVPITSELLAQVIKSVDDRRAQKSADAARANAAGAPLAAEPGQAVAVPKRQQSSVLGLLFVLALGLAVLVVGVVMFLNAME
jgi:hypothetical protein